MAVLSTTLLMRSDTMRNKTAVEPPLFYFSPPFEIGYYSFDSVEIASVQSGLESH